MKSNLVRNWSGILLMMAFIRLAAAAPAETATNQPAPIKIPKIYSNVATNPVPRPTMTNWFDKHDALVAEAKKGGIDLMFLGDSITAGWKTRGTEVWNRHYGSRHAGCFGIGGDHTQHVLWRIDNGEFEGLKPKVVVLLIGTNNSNTDTPESIAEAIKLIIQDIQKRSPDTKVLLLAIFPRNKTDDQPIRNQTNKRVNELIAKYDNGKSVRFLDLGPKFLGPDGKVPATIMPDFLHPNEQGYEIWASAMEPTLAAMLK